MYTTNPIPSAQQLLLLFGIPGAQRGEAVDPVLEVHHLAVGGERFVGRGAEAGGGGGSGVRRGSIAGELRALGLLKHIQLCINAGDQAVVLGVGLELRLEAGHAAGEVVVGGGVFGLEEVNAAVEVRVVGGEFGFELGDAVVEGGLGLEAGLEEGELAGDLVHEAILLLLIHEVLLDLAQLLAEGLERLLVDLLEGGDPVGEESVSNTEMNMKIKNKKIKTTLLHK